MQKLKNNEVDDFVKGIAKIFEFEISWDDARKIPQDLAREFWQQFLTSDSRYADKGLSFIYAVKFLCALYRVVGSEKTEQLNRLLQNYGGTDEQRSQTASKVEEQANIVAQHLQEATLLKKHVLTQYRFIVDVYFASIPDMLLIEMEYSGALPFYIVERIELERNLVRTELHCLDADIAFARTQVDGTQRHLFEACELLSNAVAAFCIVPTRASNE